MRIQDKAATQTGRHAVILCTPDPHSFNRAIADCYCEEVHAAGQETVLRDLYAMHFDPVLYSNERPTLATLVLAKDVIAEKNILWGCDVFVLIYPIWFGSAPAMMKGYVERVFGAGVTPEDVRRQDRGTLLGGKRLLSFTTSAMSQYWLSEAGQDIALTTIFDDYIVHAFGMHAREHKRFGQVTSEMDQKSVEQHLARVARQAQRTCGQVASAVRKPTP
ncbi:MULTISPECIES: NAD(P)H-dependent oxidoreductase [unclassified Sphingomonas]|uniref:NAD(P)H-dependent oxidoreductase n=1 Tax=unclassified Sphingomonas TaxID=196159 RepID=UPI0007022927|nr:MULTISPECIES: NAD(P)H-dependent oxidoreductase [unclassified Sphingomonas]KQM27940.1 NAD(P)H dehydrogenase [Sphingomonas sp. Leaf9]KQM44280.1 NAD(P)H dehydrogenase [Sphingomonas sp. Leaf11]KQM81081.1 NAD(P)H dehydrogenase [Sphingomonas sp. Leaf23]